MNSNDFEFLRQFLYQRSGLALTPDKSYLLESRLSPIARKLKLRSLPELVEHLKKGATQDLTIQIVEAMTTNETLFFRDRWPFERFTQMILPTLMEQNKSNRRVRIWCAACSSGQEPYSLAMLLSEAGAKVAGWQFEIIATDISEEMLQRCRRGWYSTFEVQRGLPPELLKKYFVKDEEGWTISEKLRSMVRFRYFNLLNDPVTAGLTALDLIFCRNVLIYFDEPTRKKVFSGMSKVMKPGGFLCLGGAETVIGISDAFRILPGERGLFGLNPQAAAAPVPAAGATSAAVPRPAMPAAAPAKGLATAPKPATASGTAPAQPFASAFARR